MILFITIYLVGLPLSVWMLANVYALIDEPRRIVALLRLVTSICLLLGILLLTNKTLLVPLLYAFATVVVMHTLWFVWLRRYGIGVPIYEPSPPTTPLLSEEAGPTASESDEAVESPK